MVSDAASVINAADDVVIGVGGESDGVTLVPIIRAICYSQSST